jgi:uncharacterized membrane protein HdeD (DUF308 family)
MSNGQAGQPRRSVLPRQLTHSVTTLALGCLAMAIPFIADSAATDLLGLVVLVSGVSELWNAFSIRGEHTRWSAFLGGGLSILIGGLLLAAPILVASALAWLLGGSFIADGLSKLLAARRNRSQQVARGTEIWGLINIALGGLIVWQWPLSGTQASGIYVGLRILLAGWTRLMTTSAEPAESEEPAPEGGPHPDRRLGLEPHPQLTQFVSVVQAEEEGRRRIDWYWQCTFVATFFAIHVGRMDAAWTLVGLSGPFIAVLGDLVYALILALGILTPLQLAWRTVTRPLERRVWTGMLERLTQGRDRGLRFRLSRIWLLARLRFAIRVQRAYISPTAAIRRGLQVGLPLTAILIAVNPIWGLSWFFNTETWAAGVWERWVEYRVDPWRQEMVRAVCRTLPDASAPDFDGLQVYPPGVADATDFSFLVIGDPGEGDASQHVLRDRYLDLGKRPDVKFLAVLSDVVYPDGAMKDYEANFYLPFKGFEKPIYGLPGNHDWYDALEGFNANFLPPESARAAMQARVATDHRLTTTTHRHIDGLIEEAGRLRREYGVRTGGQQGPYFDVQAEGFALIAVDTGVLRTVDDDQFQWLRRTLERSRGKVRMVLLGHPLYVAGAYDGGKQKLFASIHRMLREHKVEIVMAGDTHDLEYYREEYESRGGPHTLHHFVNGGGGAYLSIGTALDWPSTPPVADCAFYPCTADLTAKLASQTPLWKRPLWFWVRQFHAWPSSPELISSAFDFNSAPFFQSFMEIRVEGSASRVRLIPHGVHGPLRWRDLQCFGQTRPADLSEDDVVEFIIPMPDSR